MSETPESRDQPRRRGLASRRLSKPRDFAKALHVSERTIARWHRFREGYPRVEIGRKVYYRKESVMLWIASCERPEQRAGRPRRTRPRVTDSLRFAVSAQRDNLSPLPGSSGGDD